jgi:hypothetical protein
MTEESSARHHHPINLPVSDAEALEHGVFYALCQAAISIFCFRFDVIQSAQKPEGIL